MNDVRLCMVVHADDVPLARQLAAALAPVAGIGMWPDACSADGSEPATHYVAHGYIGAEFAAMVLGGAPAILAAMEAAQIPADAPTQAAIELLMSRADVSEDWPDEAKTRLGLATVHQEEE